MKKILVILSVVLICAMSMGVSVYAQNEDSNESLNTMDGDVGVDVNSSVVEVSNAEEFILVIKENQNANIILTQDINFLRITGGTQLVLETFSGTIDGAGYAIKNLNATLFAKLEGAILSNIVFDQAQISTSAARGILATEMNDSEISNIVFINSKLVSSNDSGTGCVAGRVNHSILNSITIKNVSISGSKIVGGLLGANVGTTILNNILMEDVVVKAGYNSGGVIGQNQSTGVLTLKDSVFKLIYNPQSGTNNRGGLIGSNVANMTMENTFIAIDAEEMNDGKVNQIIGARGGSINSLVNNYQWTESSMNSQLSTNKIYGFTKEDVDHQFFINLGLDTSIWSVNNNSFDELPKIEINEKMSEAYQNRIPTAPQSLKTIEEYDTLIKTYGLEGNFTQEQNLVILQREFIKNLGYEKAVQLFAYDAKMSEFMTWLFEDYQRLKMYVMGGAPDGGNYAYALMIYNDLYHTYNDDLYDTTVGASGLTNGHVYQKMMTSISLSYATTVRFWTAKASDVVGDLSSYDHPSVSNPLARYKVYKDLRENNLLGYAGVDGHFVFSNVMFDKLEIEEMRYVVNTAMNDSTVTWLNWYTNSELADQNHANHTTGRERNPYTYVGYNSGFSFYKSEFSDPNNFEMWDTKYDFSRFGIDQLYFDAPLPWTVFEGGAICWGISKLGDNLWSVYGVPSSAISQPGHLAYIYSSYDAANDHLYWGGIWNNISNWGSSGPGGTTAFIDKFRKRMPLTWGNDSSATGYSASYLFLSQENINHYETYTNSQTLILLENTYHGDMAKLEEIYKNSIAINPLDFDAWLGLTKLYASDASKTGTELMKHLEDISSALAYQPLPMYDLFRLIQPKLGGSNLIQYNALLEKNLNRCSNANKEDTLEYVGVQQVAKHLSGTVDSEVATFSLDGEDANTLKLSEKQFGGSNTVWDYSIDGGETWIQVESMETEFSDEELEQLGSSLEIQVHIVGVNYEPENIFSIFFTKGTMPSNGELYLNDLENKLIGSDILMQYFDQTTNTWIDLEEGYPEWINETCILKVRTKPSGHNLASDANEYGFTLDNQPDNRKYVTIDRLSIHDYTSHTSKEFPAYVIDGNIYKGFHTMKTDSKRYITIKLDEPIKLSAIEYTPRLQGANGQIMEAELYVSMDGVSYDLVGTANWNADFETKSLDLTDSVEAQYVRLHAKQGNNNFMAASMINLFEDKVIDIPTATISYSNELLTNQDVIATLTVADDVTITNNDGNNTYTFNENGNFTFEFEKNGTTGSAVATVDNIDKIAPTADIEYTVVDEKYKLAKLSNISEEIIVLNNEGSLEYLFTTNGEFTFEYQDVAGNVTHTTAVVNDIEIEPGEPVWAYNGSMEFVLLKGIDFNLPTITATVDAQEVQVLQKVYKDENEVQFDTSIVGDYTVHYIVNVDSIEKILPIYIHVIDVPDVFSHMGGSGHGLMDIYHLKSTDENATQAIVRLFENIGKINYDIIVKSKENLEENYVNYLVKISASKTSATLNHSARAKNIDEKYMNITVKVHDEVEEVIKPFYKDDNEENPEPNENTAPTIHGASNQTIEFGGSFDAMAGVSATDKEDGDLTASIKVTGTVNTNVVGTYSITYEVSDSEGLVATKTVEIIVLEENTAPSIHGTSNQTIEFGGSFDVMNGVSATDKEDGDLTSSIKVTGTVNTNAAGIYIITYTVTDSKGSTISKSVEITVLKKPEVSKPTATPKPTTSSEPSVSLKPNVNTNNGDDDSDHQTQLEDTEEELDLDTNDDVNQLTDDSKDGTDEKDDQFIDENLTDDSNIDESHKDDKNNPFIYILGVIGATLSSWFIILFIRKKNKDK